MCKKNDGNREYKDSVFRLLFGDENKSAELYNAIKGTNYAANMLKMNTLQNPLYYGSLRNDVSFTVEDKLVILLEHQSSVNPNMGLRCLFYIAEIYEQRIKANKDDLYKSTPISIENPEFYVLYNGKANYPEKSVIKLSDLFKIKGNGKINLEVIVTVYNVNKGKNKAMMKRSKTLGEYASFTAKVQEYKDKGLEVTAALNSAVKECVDENILREFLLKYGGDVVSILNMEWNLDDALRVRYNEGEQKGAEKEKSKVAEKLLKRGTPIEIVAEDTELSIEQVKEIAKKINALA